MHEDMCSQRPTFMKVILKRDSGKRRIYMKKRPLFVQKVLHSHE